jgi:hypothetical protein
MPNAVRNGKTAAFKSHSRLMLYPISRIKDIRNPGAVFSGQTSSCFQSSCDASVCKGFEHEDRDFHNGMVLGIWALVELIVIPRMHRGVA